MRGSGFQPRMAVAVKHRAKMALPPGIEERPLVAVPYSRFNNDLRLAKGLLVAAACLSSASMALTPV